MRNWDDNCIMQEFKGKKKKFPEGKNKCLVFLFGRSEN